MSKTYLAHAIEATDGAITYDIYARYLLADRQLLAYILKYTVAEFHNMAMGQVIDCIGDDIEIGTKAVDPGLSNLGRIKGADTEEHVPGEGINIYDIRFSAYLKETRGKSS